MQDLTPRQIVDALDRHIIGQADAKRAVAVAIRNRWRRRQLDEQIAAEVYPKNIVMIGPTGVGKTEIARRLARLTGAPFVKVEASKFTEVGYHGRDVESMVRDLLDQSIQMVRAEQAERVREQAKQRVGDRLLDLLLPGSEGAPTSVGVDDTNRGYVAPADSPERRQRTRDALRKQLEAGALDDKQIELTVRKRPQTSVMFANMGLDQMDPDLTNMFEKMIPEQTKHQRVTVARARRIVEEEETEKLLDPEKITAEAIERAQQSGIIFLDEIDKIAAPGSGGKGGASGGGGSGGADVSRQGVQRDLLPIVEGSAVNTRHGVVETDHILFVAAVSDLMPELQGRFPIRVELDALTKADFVRILTEPRGALTRQQQELLKVEGLDVRFEDDSIDAIADLAAKANASLENIGARRLMTIVEKVFEQINFDAPDLAAQGQTQVSITATFVREQVAAIVEDPDLSKFVL